METVCIALQALLRYPTRLREPPEGTSARVRPVSLEILQICHMERSDGKSERARLVSNSQNDLPFSSKSS